MPASSYVRQKRATPHAKNKAFCLTTHKVGRFLEAHTLSVLAPKVRGKVFWHNCNIPLNSYWLLGIFEWKLTRGVRVVK